MISRVLLAAAALSPLCHAAPVHSGHAAAEWITASTAYEPGKPLQTGIRLVVDEGWHTYWTNPGEAGSKFKVVWTLPEGWTASEVSYPVPKSFGGDLPGYGYEGEVVLPVTLTPPAGASGPVELAAKFSWLTCNDASCVPGKAEAKLSLGTGGTVDSTSVKALERFAALVPQPAENVKLTVRESGTEITLALALPAGSTLDPALAEVFPETAQAVDHAKPIRFTRSAGGWTATATKNEYAEGPLKELRLVLAQPGTAPLLAIWKAE